LARIREVLARSEYAQREEAKIDTLHIELMRKVAAVVAEEYTAAIQTWLDRRLHEEQNAGEGAANGARSSTRWIARYDPDGKRHYYRDSWLNKSVMGHPGRKENALRLKEQHERETNMAANGPVAPEERLVWCECGCGAVLTELEVARAAPVRARVEAHLRQSIGGIALRGPRPVPFAMIEQDTAATQQGAV
jgi:hypothetical protein